MQSASTFLLFAIGANIASVVECGNLKGSALPGGSGMMDAMIKGMLGTMKAAQDEAPAAPVVAQPLAQSVSAVPVALTAGSALLVPDDADDDAVNDAFSAAMSSVSDSEDEGLDEDIVVEPVAQAVVTAASPVAAATYAQLSTLKEKLAVEQYENKQLELKVGSEEKQIRDVQHMAVGKIKKLRAEVQGLQAKLTAAPVAAPVAPVAAAAPVAVVAAPIAPLVVATPVAPPAPVVVAPVAAPVVKAAPVVQVIAPVAPVAKAAPVVPVAAPVAQAAPVVPVAAPVAQAAPVVQVAAPIAPHGPPHKMNMMDMMNLFAKVQGDALANTMHTKLKANLAQQHFEVIKSADRAAGSFTHHHDHFRGIIKHEVAPQFIKFKDLLQVSESTGRRSADDVD